MTDHEALLAAADFISTDGSDLSDTAADEVAATLRRIAADYFDEIRLAAFIDILSRAGFRLTASMDETAHG